jgi:hypothetical protein
VHRRAGEPERLIDVAVTPDGPAEDESSVGVPGVQDAQRLVDPVREVVREPGDAGNGGAGVDEGEAVVMLATAMREYGGVVPAAEQAPHGYWVVFGAGLSDQFVGLVFDNLLRVQLYGVCMLIYQRSSGRRTTLGNTEKS